MILRGKEYLLITCNGTERIMFSLKEKNLVAFFPKIMCVIARNLLAFPTYFPMIFSGKNRSERSSMLFSLPPILRFRA